MREPFEQDEEYEGTLDYERTREGNSAYRVDHFLDDDYDPSEQAYYSEETDIRYATEVLGLEEYDGEEDDLG